ncbi:fasciclin domain-containing protein [Modestobacter sp. VKM Ac-2986]|uniref:fasciclin domain-containing protein n=1 Tax=Modestobacter sp. VKM Ac-2986 TaxID=3004140 RepID=UPI0022AB0864|nr:fasciclin domain-containing protein [Modestobacter sp. VKM Ac-2986]MCZ2827769.1 fasciclin domain-containing protein [Modestobacter sp. VKM Ac-2986]
MSRAAGVAAVLVLLAACTGSADDAGGAAAVNSTAGPSTAVGATTPRGPGCAMFPAAGPGSPGELAATPVAGAVGTNPQLSTLTAAVLTANLVDVVNSRQDVTVLAPSDAAFDALGADALPALLADVPRLTTVLTHHVIAGRLTADQLPGEHRTLNGDTVTIAGPPDAPTVAAGQTLAGSAPAALVCGDVPTANATVHVIDQVLAPAA